MVKENQSVATEFILQALSSQPRAQTALFILFLAVYLITVVGNILIIAVIRADCQLHSPMYFFLANLSFIDICYISSFTPRMLVSLVAEKSTISFSGCAAQMYFSLGFGIAECVMLGVMAYDRQVAICRPLLYTTLMHRKVCAQLVLASWISSLLSSMILNVLTLQLPFCGPNALNHYFCEVPAMLALACTNTALVGLVVFTFSILIVLIPFLFIVFSYAHIFSTILRIQSAGVQYKTFSTCGSHLMVVTIFYGTGIWTYMNPAPRTRRDRDKVVSLFYTVVAPVLNPLIYSLRNTAMQHALSRAVHSPRSLFI